MGDFALELPPVAKIIETSKDEEGKDEKIPDLSEGSTFDTLDDFKRAFILYVYRSEVPFRCKREKKGYLEYKCPKSIKDEEECEFDLIIRRDSDKHEIIKSNLNHTCSEPRVPNGIVIRDLLLFPEFNQQFENVEQIIQVAEKLKLPLKVKTAERLLKRLGVEPEKKNSKLTEDIVLPDDYKPVLAKGEKFRTIEEFKRMFLLWAFQNSAHHSKRKCHHEVIDYVCPSYLWTKKKNKSPDHCKFAVKLVRERNVFELKKCNLEHTCSPEEMTKCRGPQIKELMLIPELVDREYKDVRELMQVANDLRITLSRTQTYNLFHKLTGTSSRTYTKRKLSEAENSNSTDNQPNQKQKQHQHDPIVIHDAPVSIPIVNHQLDLLLPNLGPPELESNDVSLI